MRFSSRARDVVRRLWRSGAEASNRDLLPEENWSQRYCETGLVAGLESDCNFLRKSETFMISAAERSAVVGCGQRLSSRKPLAICRLTRAREIGERESLMKRLTEFELPAKPFAKAGRSRKSSGETCE